MGFTVYDYRNDVRNVLITPQIRSRFLRMDPGQVAQRHSHDLGHEVFLVLEGRALFEIDGQTQELGPGQMCIALADQLHSVSVVGDKPMTMYLSVTPHIQPTHTMYNQDGKRLPPRFMASGAYHVPDSEEPIESLIARQVAVAQEVSESGQSCYKIQKELATTLEKALADGDSEAATQARNAIWSGIYDLYKKVYHLAEAWNETAAQIEKIIKK